MDFIEMFGADALLLTVLCVARFVFGASARASVEFYCPAWLARWYEADDLTGSGTILAVEASHVS